MSAPPKAAPQTASAPLRVLTLNVHKGFTFMNRRFVLPELRDAVRGTGADVVFLQEVVGEHAEHAVRHFGWPTTPHYEFLADQIWQDFAYGRNAVYPQGHHGNALLSKSPIVHFRNHDVSHGDQERRGLLHCVLDLHGQGRQLHAVCVHMGLDAVERRKQVELLCRLLERDVPASAPLVVAGDFNDWRLHAHRAMARCKGLREAFVDTRGRTARTFPARCPLLRLDRIYVRNVAVRHAAVLSLRPWSHLSDHAALLTQIAL